MSFEKLFEGFEKRQSALWKVRETDRKEDTKWKQEIALLLQKISDTVFDGNGEDSLVNSVKIMNERHQAEDVRTETLKQLTSWLKAALVAAGALAGYLIKTLGI